MENRSSSTAESEKMLKIGFPPRRTNEKQQKLCFGHGRNAENEKNRSSAAADEPKTTKADFRSRPKSCHPLILMHGSVYIAATEAE